MLNCFMLFFKTHLRTKFSLINAQKQINNRKKYLASRKFGTLFEASYHQNYNAKTNYFEARLMVLSQKVDSKALRMAI